MFFEFFFNIGLFLKGTDILNTGGSDISGSELWLLVFRVVLECRRREVWLILATPGSDPPKFDNVTLPALIPLLLTNTTLYLLAAGSE